MSKTFEVNLKKRSAQNDAFAFSNYANGVDCGQWAYREGIKAAIEMLRNCNEVYAKQTGWNVEAAEWLEEQFKEELNK